MGYNKKLDYLIKQLNEKDKPVSGLRHEGFFLGIESIKFKWGFTGVRII